VKTIIYYFTGTGNSLAAARGICSRLDDCELVSIASLAKTSDRIKPGADRVGIVCPVYDFGLPSIVDGFVQRLDLSGTGYCFAVLTMGGFGVSALHQLDDLVFVRNHRHLDAAFVVRMVGNFVPLYEPAKGAKREKLLKDADARIAEIAGIIDKGLLVKPDIALLSAVLKRFTYGGFIQRIHDADKDFIADERCTACGTCSAVCPVKNIEMVDGKPVWKHHCEMCCACLHFCPVEAIQWGQKTKTRGRYRHPALRLSDMKAQRGE
jgi:Pyruvate/2-oxoacid:ferredoxin oxidoreductase delta subunit